MRSGFLYQRNMSEEFAGFYRGYELNANPAHFWRGHNNAGANPICRLRMTFLRDSNRDLHYFAEDFNITPRAIHTGRLAANSSYV